MYLLVYTRVYVKLLNFFIEKNKQVKLQKDKSLQARYRLYFGTQISTHKSYKKGQKCVSIGYIKAH